jgi:hypothetical protein
VAERLDNRRRTTYDAEKLAELLRGVCLLRRWNRRLGEGGLGVLPRKGYMVGDGTGNQQPLKPLLRQEAAQIIMNIVEGR